MRLAAEHWNVGTRWGLMQYTWQVERKSEMQYMELQIFYLASPLLQCSSSDSNVFIHSEQKIAIQVKHSFIHIYIIYIYIGIVYIFYYINVRNHVWASNKWCIGAYVYINCVIYFSFIYFLWMPFLLYAYGHICIRIPIHWAFRKKMQWGRGEAVITEWSLYHFFPALTCEISYWKREICLRNKQQQRK